MLNWICSGLLLRFISSKPHTLSPYSPVSKCLMFDNSSSGGMAASVDVVVWYICSCSGIWKLHLKGRNLDDMIAIYGQFQICSQTLFGSHQLSSIVQVSLRDARLGNLRRRASHPTSPPQEGKKEYTTVSSS